MYEPLKCNKCGAEIRFLKVINKEGVLKAHPVNITAGMMLCSTGRQDENDKYIYEYKKGYISHFSTCPAAVNNKQAAAAPVDNHLLTTEDIEKAPF